MSEVFAVTFNGITVLRTSTKQAAQEIIDMHPPELRKFMAIVVMPEKGYPLVAADMRKLIKIPKASKPK